MTRVGDNSGPAVDVRRAVGARQDAGTLVEDGGGEAGAAGKDRDRDVIRRLFESGEYPYRDKLARKPYEREKAALFATKEGRYLYRIEDALRRLYSDPENFGRCQATGKPINFRRLDALPHARYCIEYKRELEARGE